MTCQLSLLSLPAFASATYDSTSGISGEAPVNKIGTLLLASSLAVMNGTTIQISTRSQNAPELSGQLFKTSSSKGDVTGHAYFGQGTELAKLDATSCKEYVELTDGTRINGPVTNVTPSAVTCAGQSIPMETVTVIHSARVFKFILKTGTAPKITFAPTCPKLAAMVTPHRSKRTKIVIAIIVLAGIACAIALPIALSGHHHSNNAFNNYVAQQYLAGQSQAQSFTPPARVIFPTTGTATGVIVQTQSSVSTGSTGSTGSIGLGP